MKWDFQVGNTPDDPVFFIKNLLHWRGRRLDLHMMVKADGPRRYHTHPSYAVRIVVWGGYVEEMEDGTKRTWRPGRVGLVRPELSHRIDSLMNGRRSLSLWIRGRITHDIELRGDGWPNGKETGVTPSEGHTLPA
jgi:hypothetical protein